MLKEAASNAISKLLEYYDKTDTSIYTISLGDHIPLVEATQGKGLFRNPSHKCTFRKDIFNVVTSDRAPETIAIMCLKHWYCLGFLD
ncbi:unnamed protein product [Rhizophagus irregularis]|nr:unnamed protein product [Rhizophagus irregularis]CAB5369525.1 unnamed protein product [Rhizophagus irregularis]